MTEDASHENNKNRNTGWAITASVILSFVFYFIYKFTFAIVVALYAAYDITFVSGFGAFILLGFDPSVLGFLSGAATAKTLFKRANNVGIFYGLSTFIALTGFLQFAVETIQADTNWIIIGVYFLTVVASIAAVRFVLFNS